MAHNGITEVGKYRVIEQVGEGAMGVVYRALDPVLNRTVAIKVMSDALARDDELRNRFLREAQAAGSLQHPNVITIYDFGEVGGHLYIAMEFVAGSDLEDMLKGGVPLSIVQKIDMLVDVLNGLGYAHKRGVVHRDIKPANIRIDEEGRARIMDFGIAHLQSSTLTRSGLMVGTPAYMAPEQVSGGAISAQTDIFSVGAVMYELFTGSKPFEGESLQSVFYKIVSQPPLDFAAVAPNLPASLNRIAMRALSKAPADRYPSAADMASELSDARGKLDRVSSMPTRVSLNSSLTTGLSSRSTKPMPVVRDRSRVIAASIGAVAVVASVGIFLSMRPDDDAVIPPPVATPASAAIEAPAVTPAAPQVGVAPPPVTQSAAPAPAEKTADRTPAKTERPAPTAQELSLFRSLQTATLESRRRASEAGATTEQLRTGDNHNTLANSSLQGGRITEAMAHLNLASTAWTTAERDARAAAAAAAAAASQAKARAAEPKPQDAPPVIPPATTTAPATTVAAPPPVTSSPRPAANPVVEIEAVVVAYQRAIETRDVAELRRAYPGMTTAQARGWGDFFKTLRSIETTLSPSGVEVRGDAADARITGTYDYVTTAGKSVRQPVSFQASFRREGGAWRLIAVR